ncbi:hypothetical protein J2X72_001435 [Phyllobacterium sp. 1468]|uniref:hypothetical protein n=1 Tax=Phyllobacterium sp. 1468 TaxID=2817759 RepID=UPI002862FECC|nr:hypothetical protein [Phyllobacterium sp. 1468]MDR6632651.1 hypothetical protein [Phyllobacterium sp. 1468]
MLQDYKYEFRGFETIDASSGADKRAIKIQSMRLIEVTDEKEKTISLLALRLIYRVDDASWIDEVFADHMMRLEKDTGHAVKVSRRNGAQYDDAAVLELARMVELNCRPVASQ